MPDPRATVTIHAHDADPILTDAIYEGDTIVTIGGVNLILGIDTAHRLVDRLSRHLLQRTLADTARKAVQ